MTLVTLRENKEEELCNAGLLRYQLGKGRNAISNSLRGNGKRSMGAKACGQDQATHGNGGGRCSGELIGNLGGKLRKGLRQFLRRKEARSLLSKEKEKDAGQRGICLLSLQSVNRITQGEVLKHKKQS